MHYNEHLSRALRLTGICLCGTANVKVYAGVCIISCAVKIMQAALTFGISFQCI